MMTGHRRFAGLDPGAPLAAGLLAFSLVLGGSGSPAPLLELTLQCLMAIGAAVWLLQPQALSKVPGPAWRIAALILALPLIQLVPLPPMIWQGLPGRDGMVAALELVGAEDSWRALTLSPSRTVASLLAASAAVTSLILAASLAARGRWLLIGVIAAIGLATLLIGAAQLSGGAGNPLRFFDPNEVYLTGFQANHNSAADIILIAMLAIAALGRMALDQRLVRLAGLRLAITVLAANAVLVLGLFLAGSRAGLALLPLVLTFQYLILQPDRKIRWLRLTMSASAAAASIAAAFFLLRGNRAVEQILARFNFDGEFRPELWRDAAFALGQHWPVGSGQGTFVPVMMAAERLEVVDQTLPNRAHNDYLELAIEAGLPGLLVLAIIAAIVLRAVWLARRDPPAGSRPQVLFASGTLAVIALHSLVDYPLRSMALAAVAATAVGLLLTPRPTVQAELRGSQP